MKRRIAPLVAAFAAAVGLVPTATAQAYDSYDTTIATAQSSGVTGTESAVVINDDGLPVMAVLNDTDNTISVVACLDSACDQSDQSIIAGGIASADIDIALAPNGTPIIAYTYQTTQWGYGVRVVTCNDLACSPGATTKNIGYNGEQWHSSVALAVRSDGRPIVGYASDWSWTRNYQIVACHSTDCTQQLAPTWIDGGYGVAGDLVLDANEHPIVVVSQLDDIGAVRLHRCANANCTSKTSEQLVGHLKHPKIARSGGDVVIVGTAGSGNVNMLTCTSTCSPAQAISAAKHTGRTVDVSFIDDGHSVVAYHDTSNRLWLVDCPSTCMAPSYVTRNSGEGTLGLSVDGHDNEAYISYFQRGQSDLGLVHVLRLTNPFRGRGF